MSNQLGNDATNESLGCVVDSHGEPQLPELITDWGLYSPTSPPGEDKHKAIKHWLAKWVAADYAFDVYCVDCKRTSFFRGAGDAEAKKLLNPPPLPISSGTRSVGSYSKPELPFGPRSRNFFCVRNPMHRITVHLQIGEDGVEKIGQFPSVADMAWPELNSFKMLLGPERLSELKKSYGLFAHGVGAGSLIYLRRVLERIVELACIEKELVDGPLSESFQRKRFEDKVKELKQFLPVAFYDNRSLYGLISAGLHSLTEKDCLNIFPVAMSGIDLALSAVLARHDQANKASKVTRAVAEKADAIKRLVADRQE